MLMSLRKLKVSSHLQSWIKTLQVLDLTTESSVSYCDHSQSIGVRPSVRPQFSVNTLASTNINQSAPNLVKVYLTIRSQMSLIMELIGQELPKLSALE